MQKFILSIFLLVCLSVSAQESPGTGTFCAIPVGGGQISETLMSEILSHSGVKSPKVLIIPQAAREKNIAASAERFVKLFKSIGVTDPSVLYLSDREKALQEIEACSVIWMPGGGQVRLRKALEKAGLLEAVRDKVKTGILIGGTSAGASIMSDVMMANTAKDKETGKSHPVISYGLGLWPETMIDQHFSQRNRLWRLKEAIALHPELIGIGIDESTAVVYKGDKQFSVIGEGTVTVVRQSNEDKVPVVEVLKNGDVYAY